ncbi:RtcB family protein [Candidatus Roizmanbacteria bacterium]|nr:RtcB family protein [Candidatus Roizmanbacteria bacterium]
MISVNYFRFNKIGEAEFEINKDNTGSHLRIFADEQLLKTMDEEVFIQGRNVAQLPGLVGPVCIMPDAHSGYGAPIGTVFAMDAEKGCVSPGAVGYDINCGMRLITTNLFFEELKPSIEKLINLLFEYIPAGVGRKGFFKINREELRKIVTGGVEYLVKEKGIGWQEDIKHIEDSGKIGGADFSFVSEEAMERGISQLATLGSGNHYLEIQKVEKILNPNIAKELGIRENNQIVVMLHCGSRGFGHQICTDYLRIFEAHLSEFKIDLNDRQLVCAPIHSQYAKQYLSAMAAAANFAFVNREAITHRIRSVFEKVIGRSAEKLEMNLVYDVAHNIAKFEEHKIPNNIKKNGDRKQKHKVLVHRKGATRSFPNQPVIIGGSMETGSYLLVGSEEAMKKTYGSTAHGSGRTMSRAKAKKMVNGKNLWQNMKSKGIIVRSASWAGLAEEAGFAYKNISDVVKSVSTAELSQPVAYMKPVGNIKG